MNKSKYIVKKFIKLMKLMKGDVLDNFYKLRKKKLEISFNKAVMI